MIMYSRIVFLSVEIDFAAACVYCGTPGSLLEFSSFLTCFIYTPSLPVYITETLRIIVYFHLVFSSYLLVNRLRRRLR